MSKRPNSETAKALPPPDLTLATVQAVADLQQAKRQKTEAKLSALSKARPAAAP